mgnify:CR=1 FL=1
MAAPWLLLAHSNQYIAHNKRVLNFKQDPLGFHRFDGVDDAMELADLLHDLNEHERRMLWLRFVDGCTQREIAEIMGMSQMMVSRRLGVLLADLRSRAGSSFIGARHERRSETHR